MSAFIDALAESARDLGAKIFAGDDFKILSIDKTRPNIFVLTTPKHEVRSAKLVIAVPPGSFKDVRGSLAERIQVEKAFQSILARPAFKGAAVYPCAWWEENKETVDLYPMERFLSNSDCLGWTVPHDGRGPEGQAVLHVSYNDGKCGEKWGDILKLPKSIMDQEIHRALEYKFKREIPKPLSTVYHYWNEGAWYLQKPGSNISMKQVSDWAKRPFPDEPIFVVGSAYHPYRAYSEGAIASANNALNEGWQIPIASPLQARTHAPRRFADVDWRNIR